MTTSPDRTRSVPGPVLGIVVQIYGSWSGLTRGGITAWILTVAGALNVASSLQLMKKARD